MLSTRARHMALSITRSAYGFTVWTKAADMRLGSIHHRKKYDYERVGCTKGWVPGAEVMGIAASVVLFFFFVSTGVYERERGYRKERTCEAIAGRIGGLHFG